MDNNMISKISTAHLKLAQQDIFTTQPTINANLHQSIMPISPTQTGPLVLLSLHNKSSTRPLHSKTTQIHNNVLNSTTTSPNNVPTVPTTPTITTTLTPANNVYPLFPSIITPTNVHSQALDSISQIYNHLI